MKEGIRTGLALAFGALVFFGAWLALAAAVASPSGQIDRVVTTVSGSASAVVAAVSLVGLAVALRR